MMLRGRSIWTLGVLMLTLGLAGCLGDIPSVEQETNPSSATDVGRVPMPDLQGLDWQRVITDPAEDARAEGVAWARGSVHCPWSTDPALKDVPIIQSCGAAQGGMAVVPDRGVPAHPSFDLLAVDVAEHPEALVVAFAVSEVRADLEGTHDPETGRSAFWTLEFSGPRGCYHSIEVYAIGVAAGTIPTGIVHVFCPHEVGTDGPLANCIQGCIWEAPMAVEPGAPGTITVAAPRWIFGVDPGQATFGSARTYSAKYGGDLGVRTAIMEGPAIQPGGLFVTDDAAPERETSVRLDPVDVDPVDRFAIDDSGRVDAGSAARDAWRFTRHESWADGETVHVSLGMASLPESDANTIIEHAVVIDGAYVALTVDSTGAGWQASGTAYLDHHDAIEVPVMLTVEPGSPGRITLEVQRNQLPHAGTSELAAWGYTFIRGRTVDVVDAGPAGAVQQFGGFLDFLPPGPPLRLPPVS